MEDGRRTVVIGGSTGALTALKEIVRSLPASFPAAILVTLHLPREGRSYLPSVLRSITSLPVADAEDEESIQPGRIRIAPPDRHLRVSDSRMLVRFGPRVNRFRPAVDPLFESAARALGPRVVGVVLSGALNDGTAGLKAIKRAGGITVVQDPEDAVKGDMPASALRHVEVDHRVAAAGMGELLEELAARPPGEGSGERAVPDWEEGALAEVTCPECGGPLREVRDGDLRQYRCLIGHRHTLETLLDGQRDEVEHGLEVAQRTLEERARILDGLADETRVEELRRDYRERAEEARGQSALLRRILRGEAPA